MLQHTVLFRFKPETVEKVELSHIEQVYSQLSKLLPEDIKKVSVARNCIERPQNMDVMVTMMLANEASLQAYLTHPVHVDFTNELKELLDAVCSFDSNH